MKSLRLPWTRKRKSEKKKQKPNQDYAQIELDDVSLQRATTRLEEIAASPAATFSKEFPGWRSVVVGGLSIVSIVLAINIVTLIVAATKPANSQGATLLYEGNCSKSSSMFTGWHLLINVLGTLLLGASNACIQILAAPSRSEVDQAHKLGKSLHIGVFGFINTRFVPWNRFILIVLLSVSSIPLHLVYNSVVYNSVGAYEYDVIQATQHFLAGALWNNNMMDAQSLSASSTIRTAQKLAFGGNNKTYVPLTNDECISAFRTNFVTNYKSLILIGNSSTSSNLKSSSVTNYYPFNQDQGLSTYLGGPTYTWMCGTVYYSGLLNYCPPPAASSWMLPDADSSTGKLGQNTTTYSTFIKIDSCLAAPAPEKCTLSFNKAIMGVVIACNVVKLMCFLCTMRLQRHRPLVTIGDAIASFLAKPDQYTKARGPLSASDIRDGHCFEQDQSLWIRRNGDLTPAAAPVWHGLKWEGNRVRKYSAASRSRWIFTLGSCTILLAIGIVLLLYGINSSDGAISWSLGTASQSNLVGHTQLTLIPAALSANMIQLLISNVYILYNGIFTCMLLSTEYCEFAKKAIPLRVSNRLGLQRTTYWLSLPYIYAIPLMASISVLHWFVSGSLFVVSVDAYTTLGVRKEQDDILHLGWSSGGVILSCTLGFALVLTIILYGFRHFPSGIPVVSSNSRAISAACHRSTSEGVDTILKPIQYGVISSPDGSNSASALAGHDLKTAGFSSNEVSSLVPGEHYGGIWTGVAETSLTEDDWTPRQVGLSKDVQITVSDLSSMSIKQRPKPSEPNNNLVVPEHSHHRRGSSVASVARSVLASTTLAN